MNPTAYSEGAERFLDILKNHGMYSEAVCAAQRKPITVRLRWTTPDGKTGEFDTTAFSTLEACNRLRDRMPGAVINARVIRGDR